VVASLSLSTANSTKHSALLSFAQLQRQHGDFEKHHFECFPKVLRQSRSAEMTVSAADRTSSESGQTVLEI
jgi:hypothetical protein